MKIMRKEAAHELKYRAMTNPYVLPSERWMLDNVIADMQRCNADFVLVEIRPEEVEVWRK